MIIQPFGFLGATGGPNLIPIEDYAAYIDFGELDTMTFHTGDIIATIADYGTGSYNATGDPVTGPTLSSDPAYNSTFYTGSTSAFMNWSSLDTLIANVDPGAAANSYTIVSAMDAGTQRVQPFGVGGGSNRRLEFFNENTVLRSYIAYNRQVNLSSTGDPTKDLVQFGATEAAQDNPTPEVQLTTYNTVPVTVVDSLRWASDNPATTSRIGNTARGTANPTNNYEGRLYFVAIYHRILTVTEKDEIVAWAVDKWGLNLQ